MGDRDPVIIGGARTGIGRLLGSLAGFSAAELGGFAIKGALDRGGVRPDQVEYVIMGHVLQAGTGQITARQAAVKAGIPMSVPATVVNKVCLSGLDAIAQAADLIRLGEFDVIVAGGMESMTNAPHMVQARTGIRYGDGKLVDHMAWDGLTNPYDGKSMGVFGELCADKYHFTREEQDAFAIESVKRSQAAQQSGAFADEIAAVTVAGRKGDVTVDTDEQPGRSDIAKIPSLKPAFRKENGTITAASSSSISDGAAAVVLLSADDAKARGLQPLARIVAHATHSQEPEWFTTAPVGAIQKVLDKAGWKAADVDLFEINEAFAVVAMTPIKELGIPHEKVNVNGGACALGHPIGASGARLVVTLLNALKTRGLKRGVASLCIGGGEATAIAVERLD